MNEKLIAIVVAIAAVIAYLITRVRGDNTDDGIVTSDRIDLFTPNPPDTTDDIGQSAESLINDFIQPADADDTTIIDDADEPERDAVTETTETGENTALGDITDSIIQDTTDTTETGDISGAADAVIDDFTDRGETLTSGLNDSVSLFTDVLNGGDNQDDEESDPLGDLLP